MFESPLSLGLFAVIPLALACVSLALALARSFSQREKAHERWVIREEALRDQLWQKSGGDKPPIRYEQERVVKIPDPELNQPGNPYQQSFDDLSILQEIEHEHGLDPESITVEDAKRIYAADWKKHERWLKESRMPLRAG